MRGTSLSAAVYGGLLAVLLGAAWVKWTAEPAVELDGQVVLLPGEADDIERIVWSATGKDEALIERKSDAVGPYYWVTYTRTKPAPKDPDAPPAPEPVEGEDAPPEALTEPEATVTETEMFKAGDKGDELIKALSPMLALRMLDAVSADKLTTIGLDDPQEFLEIVRKGRSVKLELGGEVYGTRDRYVRNVATGEIYLVDDELLRPLKYARTRLPDRSLWAIPSKELRSVVLTGPGSSLSLVQENADDPDKARWVPAGDVEVNDEQLQTWMDKALKLKSSSYAGPDEAQSGLTERFGLQLQGKGDDVIHVKVFEDAEGGWWGESEHTRGKVKLLKAQTSGLADDIGAITGG